MMKGGEDAGTTSISLAERINHVSIFTLRVISERD